MMVVVHNSVYLQWFEAGRNQLLFSIMSPPELLRAGFALPVVRNVCDYRSFTVLGDKVLLTTRHKVFTKYQGSLMFHYSLVSTKDRKKVAFGETAVTAVE
jgi:acyl-CoA thioesterase FadM